MKLNFMDCLMVISVIVLITIIIFREPIDDWGYSLFHTPREP